MYLPCYSEREVIPMWNSFDKSRKELIQFAKKEFPAKAIGLGEKVREIIDQQQPFSQAKADALVFLLNNIPVMVDPANLFVWRFDHGNIMTQVRSLRETECKQSFMKETATEYEQVRAFVNNLDFGHIGPDWSYLLQRGIPGVIEDLENGGQTPYYTERIAVYRAIAAFLERFADSATVLATPKGDFVAKNLRTLVVSPPKTMAQALQLILILYVLQTHIDGVIIRSLGGLDRMLYPYYQNDLRSGAFTKAQLEEIVCYFFQTISSMEVCANLPFYICGMDEKGEDTTNELTYLLLEQYRALDIYDPKIHVMYHPGIDPNIVRMVEEMIREGKNSFVFINTPLATKSLEKIGISPEDAKKVAVYGCYETAAEGTEIPCTCAGEVNMAKSIEMVLDSGKHFSDFQAFYEGVLDQLEDYTLSCMDAIASCEPHFPNICPSMILSPTYRHSRESGIDVYSGGAKYNNTSIVGAGLATLVDSLLVVQKLVFEEKQISLEEFREILRSNWETDPNLRLLVRKKYPKYGNHIPEADQIATDIYERFSGWINGRKNGRGGVFRCGMFSVDWRYWMGREMGATPDGRRKGEPISKNLAASVGQDKCGVTAYLGSLLALDGQDCPDGYVADVALHQSAVKGEEGLCAFHGLLTTFMEKGGFSVHFNILSPDTLISAQKEPEKYRNLQIRLCGWNVRFVDLDRAAQDEFILQSQKMM